METIVQREYDKDKHLKLIKNNIKNKERSDYTILIGYQVFYERREEILNLCTEFLEMKIDIFTFCRSFMNLVNTISTFSNDICTNCEKLEQFQINPQFMNMDNFRVKVNCISHTVDDFYYLYLYEDFYEDDAEPFLGCPNLFVLIREYSYELIPFYKDIKTFVDSEIKKDTPQSLEKPKNE